jgi:4-hydroxybenzoate polyprenyltransferase
MKHIFKLIRPEQWAKNLFVFLPVFFGGQLLNLSALLSCVAAFAAFSFAASSVYCFNDIIDAETDKAHPEKRNRPVASGAIAVKTAYAATAVCLLLSIAVLFFSNYVLAALILFYYLMNIAYCVKLKDYAIIDVIIISVGFVLRVSAGGVASGIRCSEWIIIMTFLLALFLAFAKRRDDVIRYVNTSVSHRKNTCRYNTEFMNHIITVVAAVAIIAYIMYTLSPEVIDYYNSRHIYITGIFVLTGIIRYLQLTIVDVKSGSPTKILLRDRFIQCCIAGWIVLFLIIIYSNAIIAAVRTAIP